MTNIAYRRTARQTELAEVIELDSRRPRPAFEGLSPAERAARLQNAVDDALALFGKPRRANVVGIVEKALT